MILHKLVSGVRAATYLPYALGRMRALNQMYGDRAFFTEKYLIDGVEIEVRQTPPSQYVRLTDAGQFDFEFTTSGKPVQVTTVTQDGLTLGSYKAATVACKFSNEGGSLRIAPRIVNGTRIVGAANSRNKRQFQVELTNEPMSFPRPVSVSGKKRFPLALYESFAPGNPHTGVHTRNTSWGFEIPRADAWALDVGEVATWQSAWYLEMGRDTFPKRGAIDPQIVRDILYDVPYQDSMGTQPVRSAYIRGDADWPRASSRQKVTDATHGTREFAIYVDAFNQFYIFPVDAIEPIDPDAPYDQNVDASYVQKPTITWPTGAYLPSVRFKDYFAAGGTAAQRLIDLPELDWKFNHLGTKAASIVYSRAPFEFDAADFALDPGLYPMTATEFAELRDQLGMSGRQGFYPFDPTHNPDRFFVAPGILQARVTISLTGPHLEDFIADIAIDVIRDPAVSDYCPLAVGYAWYDLKDDVGSTPETPVWKARAGDMIAFDVEQWSFPGVAIKPPPISMLSVKNITQAKEVFCSATPMGIMAIDIPTLSFALRVDYWDYYHDPDSLTNDRMTLHFAVALMHKMKVKTTLYPKTMVAEKRAVIEAMVTDLPNGAAQRAGRYLVSLAEATGWSDPAFQAARRYQTGPAQPADPTGNIFMKNHATIVPLTPAIKEALTKVKYDWVTFLNNVFLVYCTAPKWGWHLYADLICNYLNVSTATTFYVHPNGTYCFWDNSQVYNPIGAASGLGRYNNQLTPWDVTKVEHCVFDYVHATQGAAGASTTFQSLYNKAVAAGEADDTLVDPFAQITDADLRATFTKSSVAYGGVNTLRVLANWDGVTSALDDITVQDGTETGGSVAVPMTTSIEASFDGHWINPATDVSTLPHRTGWHIRFANPMVLVDAAA